MASKERKLRPDREYERERDGFESEAIGVRLRADLAAILVEPLPAEVSDLLARLARRATISQGRLG